MRTRCIEVDESGMQVVVSEQRPSSKWLTAESPRWLDIEAGEVDDLTEILSPLGLSPELPALCSSHSRGTSETVIGGWYYFLIGLPDDGRSDGGRLSILFGESLLVTVHSSRSEHLERLIETVVQGSKLPARTTSALLLQLLVILEEGDTLEYFELRDRLDELVGSIDEVPDEVDVELTLRMKRRVAALLSNCEDHIYVCGWAWDLEQMRDGRLAESFRITYQALDRFRSVLMRSERRLQHLHQEYQMTLQETTNSRLRVLTVLSAVFMPMTLIAGVYGMNFQHMPELDERWAYFIVLGGMGMMGFGMLAFFYVKGWFK